MPHSIVRLPDPLWNQEPAGKQYLENASHNRKTMKTIHLIISKICFKLIPVIPYINIGAGSARHGIRHEPPQGEEVMKRMDVSRLGLPMARGRCFS
jgi:hypothetical protein